MHEERESQPMSVEARALELAARVTVRRISNVISHEKRSRVMYALVDLGSALTSAIGRALADRSREDAKIEVAIHPELAVDGLSDELQTSEEATRLRNRRREGVVATVFSVPARQMEGVLQSLGTVERVNEAWLCDPAKANLWAMETLPDYFEQTQEQFEEILRGVMNSGILASAEMLAIFCTEVHEAMDNPQGLDLGSAVNRALPALRLPRECAPEMKAKTLAAKPAVQFRRWRDEFQPHLYLEAKDGQVRPRQELLVRIDGLMVSGGLTADAAQALRDLVKGAALLRRRPNQSLRQRGRRQLDPSRRGEGAAEGTGGRWYLCRQRRLGVFRWYSRAWWRVSVRINAPAARGGLRTVATAAKCHRAPVDYHPVAGQMPTGLQ